jgi:hypothetical protein
MSLCPDTHHLAYTIAFDPPGSPGHRTMAKMLASSLLRTYFGGDIIIFRNSPEPLFRIERKGLDEIYIDTPQLGGLEGAQDAWCWKYRVKEYIDAKKYDKILFLDADCLALRNVDHLLEGEWDIAYQTERGLNIGLPQFSAFLTDNERTGLKRDGVNSGHLAIRGSIYHDVMTEWQRIDTGPVRKGSGCLDQGSWNRLILDEETAWRRTYGYGSKDGKATTSDRDIAMCTRNAVHDAKHNRPWKTVHFERGEIQFPMHLDPKVADYRDAALVHCLGGNTRHKLQFMFGLYMSAFFYDDTAVMLNLLEM